MPDKPENFKDILLQGLTEVRSSGITQQAQAAGPLSLPQPPMLRWLLLPVGAASGISIQDQLL